MISGHHACGAQFCDALGTPEAATWKDEAHAWGTPGGRSKDRDALVRTLDEVLGAHDVTHWGARFDKHGVIWAPIAELSELVILAPPILMLATLSLSLSPRIHRPSSAFAC